MKSKIVFSFLLIAIVAMFTLPTGAYSDELPMANGTHWLKSSESEKLAFLLGAGTILKIEQAYQADSPCEGSLVNSWVQGLSGQTIHSISEGLTQYYSENPDKLDRAVIEVIWFEFTKPNLK